MKRIGRITVYVIAIFFLLPIVLSIAFQNEFSLSKNETEKLENYLPYVLFDIIEEDMHMETLKAQAVLIRTNLMKKIRDKELLDQAFFDKNTFAKKEKTKEDEEHLKRLRMACQATEGEVVLYEGDLCDCPFFYCSNGLTRDAFTFFQDTRYPYLISVPSYRDEECTTYVTYHYFSIETFLKKMNEVSCDTFANGIEILDYDTSGYITWLKAGEQVIGGEVFRETLGLSSSCFSIEQAEEGIRIACKGKGHGFGFSQYGANAMARDKKNYRELIAYYFQDITIEKVYSFS